MSHRRSWVVPVALAASAFLLASGQGSPAPSGAAGPLTPVSFRFDWISTPADTPVRVAMAKGFFSDAGLDVTATTGSGSTDSVTLTGAGQHDIAIASSLPVVVGVEQGIPVESVGVLYQTDPNGILSLPSNPIDSAKALEGKKFGLQQGSSQVMYQALVGAAGIDRSKVTEVPIGFGVEPLLQQQVDAMIDFGDGEFIIIGQAIGEDPVWVPLGQYGVDPYGSTIIANKTFAQEHPEAVKGFLDAYARGLAYSLEHPDEAVTIAQAAYPEVDPATLGLEIHAALPYWVNDDTAANGLLHQDATRWQHTVDIAKSVGLISADVDPSSVYTNDFLPDPAVMASPAAG